MSMLLRGDYHVHSTFSDDARSTIGENLAAAQHAGLAEIRMVDHVRASTSWVPEFVRAVSALDVPEDVRVYTGVETKMLDASGSLDLPPLPKGIDRVLIADHQFPGAEGPLSPREVQSRMALGWQADDVLDTFVEAVIAAVTRHPGQQLAHCFSLLPKIGLTEQDLGAERLSAWAAAAARTDTLIEINEKWACPGPEAIFAARRAGALLVAATDSHEAADVGKYERVPELLAESGTVA